MRLPSLVALALTVAGCGGALVADGVRAPGELLELSAPPYRLFYPRSLSREAEQIAAAVPATIERLSRDLGATPLPPSTLYLLAAKSASLVGADAKAMPEWAAGIALPGSLTVIIRADRVGRYPLRRLESVLAHETAHLLMFQAAGLGAGRMPAWFREGVAASLAREGEWMDFFYLWISPVTSSDRPLAQLTAGFAPGSLPSATRTSYAGSFSFVRFVNQKHSAALPAKILAGLREGLDFETAYRTAAGTELALDEAAWSSSIRGRTRWAAILTSSATLWLTITSMVLVAYLLKRRRARRVLEQWQEEDPFE